MYRVFASASADNPHPRIIHIIRIRGYSALFLCIRTRIPHLWHINYPHRHLHRILNAINLLNAISSALDRGGYVVDVV